MPKKVIPLEIRFWSRVDKETSPNFWDGTRCWIWTGSTSKAGYGQISRGLRTGKDELAHRLSWEFHFGSIPDNLFVCHHCDNRKCVNPHHLFLGTHIDNMRDCWQKGRNIFQKQPEKLARGDRNGARLHIERMPRGERNGFAKITEDIVRSIRAEYPQLSQRQLANKYRISQANVWKILKRETWFHI